MQLTVQALSQDGSIMDEDTIEISNGSMLVLQAVDESVTLDRLFHAFKVLKEGVFNMKSNPKEVGMIGLPYGMSLKVVSVESK